MNKNFFKYDSSLVGSVSDLNKFLVEKTINIGWDFNKNKTDCVQKNVVAPAVRCSANFGWMSSSFWLDVACVSLPT